jgi:hypothetical protein
LFEILGSYRMGIGHSFSPSFHPVKIIASYVFIILQNVFKATLFRGKFGGKTVYRIQM